MQFVKQPARECDLCPRLVHLRRELQKLNQDWFNGAVPNFGSAGAAGLIVGLAPGMRGANRTGRPFTGDYAGDLLYQSLLRFGLARGEYKASPDDGLELKNCAITNAVRCLPPANKPEPSEIRNCNGFLRASIQHMSNLRAILCLGRVSHQAVCRALQLRQSEFPFVHRKVHHTKQLVIVDCYHCSRYNTNTGRLTEKMFHDVMECFATEIKGKCTSSIKN